MKKRIDWLTVAICALIFGAPLGWMAGDIYLNRTIPVVVTDVVETTPTVPRDVVIGELIELEVKGDDVAWAVAPPCIDKAVVGDSRSRLHVCFRHGGAHSVYAASSLDGKAAITRFDFIVASGPDPEPDPDPDPEPDPEPTPNPKPVEDEWLVRLQGWGTGPNADAVADAFTEAAEWSQDRLDDSKLTTHKQMLSKTTTAVNKAVKEKSEWRPFFDGLAAHLAGEAADNALVTQQDYIRTWHKIAGTLRKL